MILRGKSIVKGYAEGEVVATTEKISFLEGIDPTTSQILQKCDVEGHRIEGKIFAFRGGRGSTVGIYSIYGLKYYGKMPLGFITEYTDDIVVCGAALISIPYISSIPVEVLRTGDFVVLNATDGYVEVKDVILRKVVTSFLKKGDMIAIFRRSGKVSTYRGKWAGISGSVESDESPEEAALREIEEEVGIGRERLSLIKSGKPLYVRDGKTVWKVYPFLWELKGCDEINIDWEHSEYRWIKPEALKNYDTVPKLYETLRRVWSG